MEKAFFIDLTAYAPILKSMKLVFREDGKSLTVGKIEAGAGFAIFLSCRTLDTPKMLGLILPVLKKYGVSFRLIKNQIMQYRLNSGDFGEDEVGKVVTIFPTEITAALKLSEELNDLVEDFDGPVIISAQRIGRVVYIQSVTECEGRIVLSSPAKKNFPFFIPARFRQKAKRNAVVGKYYLPVQVLRASAKGNIYKGINLKKFAFTWCLIKQGNPVALDDHFNRDMRDRLLWQKEVIETIGTGVNTPSVIGYFEQNEKSYLVLDFLEGQSLGEIVRKQLHGKTWRQLDPVSKYHLLVYYLKALDIIGKIHERGFVHRDISDSNFMIMENNAIGIIDFELAYSLAEKKPNPPFLLGTIGYAAPEQLQYALPDVKEDIYSLGALLCFLLTAAAPDEFLTGNLQVSKAKLLRLTDAALLTGLVVDCLQLNRKNRPVLGKLKEIITTYITMIKIEDHEKIAMVI